MPEGLVQCELYYAPQHAALNHNLTAETLARSFVIWAVYEIQFELRGYGGSTL